MTRSDGRRNDEYWMSLALREAQKALQEGEVPIGAVAVFDGEMVAADHNRSIQLHDPTGHAEILVLRAAGVLKANYRLLGLELFVTLEPCAMCAGALLWARVGRLVYGATDKKSGAVESKVSLLASGLFNHSVSYRSGVLKKPCLGILQDFFSARRS